MGAVIGYFGGGTGVGASAFKGLYLLEDVGDFLRNKLFKFILNKRQT